MSLLILQTQSPQHSLAKDSYGVISTAAMLDQEVSVVFCGEGLQQLENADFLEQLKTCEEFGVKAIYACVSSTDINLPTSVKPIASEKLSYLIHQHTAVLSF